MLLSGAEVRGEVKEAKLVRGRDQGGIKDGEGELCRASNWLRDI